MLNLICLIHYKNLSVQTTISCFALYVSDYFLARSVTCQYVTSPDQKTVQHITPDWFWYELLTCIIGDL